MSTDQEQKRPRGFATWEKRKLREVAVKGGQMAHASGHAHEFTTEEARLAGAKGGRASAKAKVEAAAIPLDSEKLEETIPPPAPRPRFDHREDGEDCSRGRE